MPSNTTLICFQLGQRPIKVVLLGMVNKLVVITGFIFAVSGMGVANFVFTESNSAFAQSQSPCSGSASITDTSQAQPGILLVVSNSAQATFIITGPATYRGSGYVWAQQGISAGTYTVTWKPVSGCASPPPETKTTDSRGSVAFAGSYVSSGGSVLPSPTPLPTAYPTAPSPTSKTKTTTTPYAVPTAAPQTAPGKAKLVITSVPDGATVYINNVLAGKAPLTYRVGEGSQQIRCVLAGYDDYYYGAGISDYGARDGTTVEIICKMPPSSSGPGNRLQNLPRDDTSSPEPALVVPQKPKGFFSRFWQRILSLFGR